MAILSIPTQLNEQAEKERLRKELSRLLAEDWSVARDHIYIAACDATHKDALPDRTILREHRRSGLIEYFRIVVPGDAGALSQIITDDECNFWDISYEELHEAAVSNTAKCAVLRPLEDADVSSRTKAVFDKVYRLTVSNDGGCHGAGAIFLPNEKNPLSTLDELYGFIPLSVDSWLCVPQENFSPRDLLMLNLQNNANLFEEDPASILSTGVFLYAPNVPELADDPLVKVLDVRVGEEEDE